MWVTSSLTRALRPTAVALGNFDGVHRGHQQVIQGILASASPSESILTPPITGDIPRPNLHRYSSETEEIGAEHLPSSTEAQIEPPPPTRVYTTVLTFNPHPQEFFSRQPRCLLTTTEEKASQLRLLGVDQLVLLPFDRELAQLTPQEFVEEILVRQLQVKRVSVGQDFRFGRQRAGTADDLRSIAATHGIKVTVVPLYRFEGERISSSNIRQALIDGEVERANGLLGRAYRLTGTVTKGQQLGRTLGFPTANLQLPPEKFLPRWGVYRVRVDGQTLKGQPGVMNVGCRPTVSGEHPSVEVHLLDWSGDLYGQTLSASLECFLRPEQKFESLEALKAQIQRDCDRSWKLATEEHQGES